MASFFTSLKKKWEIATVVISIVAVIVTGTLKVSSADKRMTTIEETQHTMAGLQDKLFDFTMKLWSVDPTQVKKWKALPQELPKDSVGNPIFDSPWLEIDGNCLLMHKLIKDSTGKDKVLVDTLFTYKKDSTQTSR